MGTLCRHYRREGIKGINMGVNVVACRQMTNGGSRMGFARLADASVRPISGKSEKDKLSAAERIACSTIGGTLVMWNQPIESMAKAANWAAKLNILSAAKYSYSLNGLLGLYRGVTPRICLGVWQTICVVTLADYVKEFIAGKSK